ncbi:sulfotransferase family 2 domain-containing protein [Psychroserpens sp. XS_ASV72]|uniref:sulfotransferase family 2 domain-containing protein n=1 Tax=Psychroserpens sp. XS_ASV72 TaxID=3241293 RepID=UPI0035154417
MDVLKWFHKKKHKTDKVFVHIGKCGGSSVLDEFKKRNMKFQEKHVAAFKFRKKKKYCIIIRNPISRFVSAFNWRYKLVVEDEVQKDMFEGEHTLLKTYKNVNDLAENIYDENGNLVLDFKSDAYYIHHIKEDIDFYIGNLLKKCKKKHIMAVLATETLSDDLERHFGISLNSHLKKNKKDKYLSPLALKNLTRYLEKDFACIERLNTLGCLTSEQYKLLSNKEF